MIVHMVSLSEVFMDGHVKYLSADFDKSVHYALNFLVFPGCLYFLTAALEYITL